jgi:hypothetical protein
MFTVQLITFLHLNCAPPDIFGVDVDAFWKLVANMILSTDIPVSYSDKHGSVYGIVSVVIKVIYTSTMDFSLTSKKDLVDGMALPSICGIVYPLSTDDLSLILLVDRASQRSLVLGDGSSIYNLLLGPLALANRACDINATAVPDLNCKLRVRDLLTGLSATD